MLDALGVIVSGRLVQTSFSTIDDTHFLINIPDADNINHVVVFLTGSQPFPEGVAGGVYFSWPDPTAPPSWQYLGHISNSKPSAIFKISQLKKLDEINGITHNVFGANLPISHIAQIGVSVEPESTLLQQTPSVLSTASYLQFGQKMLENFFNFVTSFTLTQSQMVPSPNETFVPLSTIQTWFTNFQRRLEQNPNFWKN